MLAQSTEASLAGLGARGLELLAIGAGDLEVDWHKVPHLLAVAGRVLSQHVPLVKRHEHRALLTQTVTTVSKDVGLDNDRSLVEVPVLVEGRVPQKALLILPVSLTALVHGLAIVAPSHLIGAVNATRLFAHDAVAARDLEVARFHAQELDVSSLIHNTVLSLIKVVVVHVVVLRVVLIAVLIVAILITIAVLLLVAVLIAFGTIVLVVPVAVVVIVIVLIVVSKLPLIILLILIHKVLIPVKIFLRFLQPVVLLVVIPLCAGPGQQHHHQRGGQDVLHAYPHRGLVVGASQRASCRSAGSC
mmetsp:Transcript_16306/g.41703  ORF Transcript_16306/g.41703 Transcript_16306/m.41703 type:complete len:302 (+) Transcript_16306:484-1389(+)